MTQNEYALIVAAGKGTRFGRETPKQFADLNGKPVLLHTLEAFYRYSEKITIVLVLAHEHFTTWENICRRYAFSKKITLVEGGASRFQSVRNGLAIMPDQAYVAIHDGVRPLVSVEIISASFRLAKVHGAAIAAVDSKDSIRSLSGEPAGSDNVVTKSNAEDRSLYRMIQTPQTFQAGIIKQAYAGAEDPSLTDDASVAERAGQNVVLFPGSFHNIKITTPEDLVVAEALLAGR